MNYPQFFDNVKPIQLQDKLAMTLGAFYDGKYEITYKEVVKSAGHSCPTVAGAYLMTQSALDALYGDNTPQRGEIKVSFSETQEEGVAGVIGMVVSMITGATTDNGFKGLSGKFARTNLMAFDQKISSSARFTRTDTNESVDVTYDPSFASVNPRQMELMKKMMQGISSKDELKEFGLLWQQRVENIMLDTSNRAITLQKVTI